MAQAAAGKMVQREAAVEVFQDDATGGVWGASSQNIPGLATEGASLDALAVKLQCLIPEFCALNGVQSPSALVLHVRLLPALQAPCAEGHGARR